MRDSWPPATASWRSVLPVIILLAAFPAAADEIYKSVDAEGHVVYSDRASTANAKKSDVRVQEPDAAEAARQAKETALLQAQDVQRKQQEAVETRNKTHQDQVKQQLCQAARNRYNVIKDVGRMYHVDADGNRVFYTDAEVDARREQARQSMVSACGK